MRYGIVVTGLWLLASALPAVAPTSVRAAAPGNPVTTETSCNDYQPQGSAARRLQAGNRGRLVAAQAILAPGFSAGRAEDGLQLLADYQEEMERVKPDVSAAAVYLASVSTVPVTLPLLQALNSTLCIAASARTAEAIAVLAEATRQEMSR